MTVFRFLPQAPQALSPITILLYSKLLLFLCAHTSQSRPWFYFWTTRRFFKLVIWTIEALYFYRRDPFAGLSTARYALSCVNWSPYCLLKFFVGAHVSGPGLSFDQVYIDFKNNRTIEWELWLLRAEDIIQRKSINYTRVYLAPPVFWLTNTIATHA